MMAEIAGKETGYCRGKGGSMHIADMSLGHLGANAIVGGGIPSVVGAGLAHKRDGKGAVSIAFYGDGAMQQGVLYEAMNMAALWHLPVVFCCINNQWGMGTRVDRAAASTRFDERARAFGLAAAIADGANIHDTVEKAETIVGDAREGRPGFLAVECYRFFGHARMDKSPYRNEDEEAEGRRRDPVANLRSTLGDATAELDRIDAEAADEMNAAIDFAVASPSPEAALTFRDVYADDEPAPTPMRARLAAILADEPSL
jgi:pyruvate dehydrogenase E1 component alpha subunit